MNGSELEGWMNNLNGIYQSVLELLIAYGFKLLGALMIILVGAWGVKAVKQILHKQLLKTKFDNSFNNFLVSTAATILWIFIVLAILAKFGIEIAPLIAGLGVAGFAIGFAVQGSLSNFASGVMMIVLKPFRIGDLVEISGIVGEVREIGIMTCTIATPDNRKVIVPNSNIFGQNITNLSGFDKRRVDMSIGISYSSDIDEARRVLTAAIAELPKFLREPAPMVGVTEMADSSVNLTVRGWCRPVDYWDAFFGGNEAIKKSLDKAGIAIPFPQRDVWTRSKSEN